MQSRLGRLKSKVKAQSDLTVNTEIYLLAKELGCLPDLLGREYEVEYEEVKIWIFKWWRISKIKQLPMSIPSFIGLMDEMQKDAKRQEKQMKSKRKKK